MITRIKSFIRKIAEHERTLIEKEAPEAYDLWASSYDKQPDNLMLALDEQIFTKLFETVSVNRKSVADIGCGTGRHWSKILAKLPCKITGYDVSKEMLNKLQSKYPDADLNHISNDLFSETPDESFDLIISTLTIAHIADLEAAIANWCRISKSWADIIITDFHPEALALGGSRTFPHHFQMISVKNHVHTLDTLKEKFSEQGFSIVQVLTRKVDENVRHYYQNQRALEIFEKFKGVPMIYGMHLRRRDVIE